MTFQVQIFYQIWKSNHSIMFFIQYFFYGEKNTTLLHEAVMYQNLEIIKLLVNCEGIKIDATDGIWNWWFKWYSENKF